MKRYYLGMEIEEGKFFELELGLIFQIYPGILESIEIEKEKIQESKPIQRCLTTTHRIQFEEWTCEFKVETSRIEGFWVFLNKYVAVLPIMKAPPASEQYDID